MIGVAPDEVGRAEHVLDGWPAVRVDWCGRAARDRGEPYAHSVVSSRADRSPGGKAELGDGGVSAVGRWRPRPPAPVPP